MTLRPPASINEFQVGDEVECLQGAYTTRTGIHYRVIAAGPNRLNLADMDGNQLVGFSHGTTSWQRFAIVDGDNPNY